MTPIFSRIWLVKMHTVRALEISEVSLRIAALISRAWAPTVESPISPSSSCRGDQRGHRVEHDHVDRVRAHQRLADLQRLLAGVRLGHQQVVEVDAELLGVLRVERVLDVDERRQPAALLGLGDHGAGSASSCRTTPGRRPRRSGRAGSRRRPSARSMRRLPVGMTSTSTRWLVAHPHDRAFAELLLDLGDRHVEVAFAGIGELVGLRVRFRLCGGRSRSGSGSRGGGGHRIGAGGGAVAITFGFRCFGSGGGRGRRPNLRNWKKPRLFVVFVALAGVGSRVVVGISRSPVGSNEYWFDCAVNSWFL